MKKAVSALISILAGISVVLGIFILIGSLTYDTPATHDAKGVLFGSAIFFLAIGIFMIFLARKALRDDTTKNLPSRNLRLFDPAQGLQAVNPSGLILRANEECFLIEPVQAARSKEITAGYAGRSAGLSVRVAKGVTLHSGANRGVPIKKTVLEKYTGTLYITSQRIILTAPKFGFEKKLSSLVNVTRYQDGLSFQFGSTSNLILTSEPLYIHGLLNHVIDTCLYKTNKTPQVGSLKNKKAQLPVPADKDDEVPTPDGAELSYLDAAALKFWDKKHTDFNVPQYYSNTPFGRNAGPALRRLLDGGYLAVGGIEKSIQIKTVSDIKAILSEKELKTSGKKDELVQRLIDNVQLDELQALFPVGVYELTSSGKNALEPYSIIFENQNYNLGISYYRLLAEKSAYPDEKDEVIIAKIFNEDIENCYKTNDRAAFQEIMPKVAMYLDGHGDSELALKTYILSYFVWTKDIEKSVPDTNSQNHYLSCNVEKYSKLCGFSFKQLEDFFRTAVQSCNPFGLGTVENIDTALAMLKQGLGIK